MKDGIMFLIIGISIVSLVILHTIQEYEIDYLKRQVSELSENVNIHNE